MNSYKLIRDGPSGNLMLIWSYAENLMPRHCNWANRMRVQSSILDSVLAWMHSGYRKTEFRGNDLSGSWHWQAVTSGDSVIE